MESKQKTEKSKTTLTVEQLQKQIEELQKQLETRPKTLEEQIAYFEEKKRKIEHLRTFELTREKLGQLAQEIRKSIESDETNNEYHRLQFVSGRYGNDSVKLTISNNRVIMDAIAYVVSRVVEKMVELEKEIAE